MIIPNPNFYVRHWPAEISPAPSPSLTVMDTTPATVQTGLVDANGTPIVRRVEPPRIGYLPQHGKGSTA